MNQRLVQLGVDPLKNRLPKNAFQKQRTMLQEQQQIKAKVSLTYLGLFLLLT